MIEPNIPLLEVVYRNTLAEPNQTAFAFVRRRGESGESISLGALWASAARLATQLPMRAVAEQTGVMLFCGDARNLITALVATWMRGATVIPAAGGMTASVLDRNQQIVAASQPDVILHDLAPRKAAELARIAPETCILDLSVVAEGDIPEGPLFKPDSLRGGPLLQFTSGSTDVAKAVFLTPEDIAMNAQHIATTYGLGPDGVVVNWLPLYHDMGLVGSILAPLYAGQLSVLIRSSVFVQDPLEWLRHLSDWQGTITSSPNFAYEMLVRRLDAAQSGDWDLSHLKTVICGGEPVRKDTMDRLLDRLGRYGLCKESIAPSYGLAEAVLMVCSGQRDEGPFFLDRDNGQPSACLGRPSDDLRIDIRERSTGASVADGTLGELWISGEGCGRVIAAGESWRTLRPKSPIRTGDQGMIVDGELYVTGRDADRIILRGVNVLAEEVEAIIYASQPETTAANGVVAFGVEKNETQVLHVIVERGRNDARFDRPSFEAMLSVTLGVSCDVVTIARRGTLPRTTSGKVRRAAARDAYLLSKDTQE